MSVPRTVSEIFSIKLRRDLEVGVRSRLRSLQPGFDLPRQHWSLLNRFCTEQGHCGACRRKWQLTDTDLCPCGETQTMFHIVESCPDKTEWRLISATLCGWRHCFVADQLWFMTRIREEELKMVPFESFGMVSYLHSIVSVALPYITAEIEWDIGLRFFSYPLHLTPPLGGPCRSTVWYEKLEWCGYLMVKKFDDMFNHFDTIPACDIWTDWQTDD